ncbi:sulfotransferase [Microcoleus sp. FACHB-672]|uniref:sulfotransferase n=1 Tax=Microcoleus sp. FACHB-672 TaxID=2692825 RepID=UPI00281649DD|nr:sulfotransferase [Microcoleus sp. FACHB-672]
MWKVHKALTVAILEAARICSSYSFLFYMMLNQIHFISGLPRSGSTLLSAILRQNPRFHAGMTSPVEALVERMLEAISENNEYSVFISPEQKQALIFYCLGE